MSVFASQSMIRSIVSRDHDLFALRPGVHMAMHAGEIAKLAHIDLKNVGSRTTKRDRLFGQLVRETVHSRSNSRRDAIKVIPSGVEEPRSVTFR